MLLQAAHHVGHVAVGLAFASRFDVEWQPKGDRIVPIEESLIRRM
jgi:hypothetical protein